MPYSKPVEQIIRERFSCREYLVKPIDQEARMKLSDAIHAVRGGPLGTALRFSLVAATGRDSEELRGLGTYGFVRNPAGFIIGAAASAEKSLEDYGFEMERLILSAIDLGLGTCWLGGFFTRSSFARRMGVAEGERVPAVAALGIIDDIERARNRGLRRWLDANRRLPWDSLFFDGSFGVPLKGVEAGQFAGPLEMVRLGPSASNRQPWRIVREGKTWHFFLRRTRGYSRSLSTLLFKMEDIQRLDIGIAMCHFELAANELELKGKWMVRAPRIEVPDALTEYVVSWD